MFFGIIMLVAGALLIVGAATFSRSLARPNQAFGARAPSRASFVLVGVGFVILGVAALFGLI